MAATTDVAGVVARGAREGGQERERRKRDIMEKGEGVSWFL